MAVVAERMNTTLPVAITLTGQQQQQIQHMMQQDIASCPIDRLRTRLLLLDLAYYMENSEHVDQTAASKIITTIYKELELPIMQPNINAAHAYLVGTFCSGHPIFGVVADPNDNSPEAEQLKVAAKQMEAIIEENAKLTGWSRQMNLWFKSGLKYNFAALEADWKVRKTFVPVTDTNRNIRAAAIDEVYRAGNELKSLDMYNIFFDISVAPADIHTKGDFVGYFEQFTFARLHKFVEELQTKGGTVMNIGDQLWKSSPYRNQYHTPKIIDDTVVQAGTNWLAFLGLWDSNPMQKSANPMYEVCTYYRRIVPSMLGINHVPSKDSVQIWKFIEVNGIIIYAERRSNAHDLLPVIFLQPHEDNIGHQSKGLGDTLIKFQKLSSTMWRARIASLARALSDRGLYDPSRVSEKNINSVIPSAKIPVRPSAYGKPVNEAYHAIPYDDRNAQNLHMDISRVAEWAGDAANINRSQRGQFTKGNRTLQEYADVMDNAEAPQQAMAILIEDQAITPLKTIIKTNILQYQSSTTLPDPNTKQPVQIDPVELRRATLEFKIADGLISKDKLMGTQQTLEAFQIMAQTEGANQEYDLIGMIVESMENRGARLKHHKRQQQVAFNTNQLPAPAPQGGAPQGDSQGATPPAGVPTA